MDGKILGELSRQSVQKYESALGLLRYNIHICCFSDINAVCQCFRCPNCDTFFIRTSNVRRHLTFVVNEWNTFIPRNFIKTGNSFWQAGVFWNWIHNRAGTTQEYTCIWFWIYLCADESFKDTDTAKWIGKYIRDSVSFFSNPVGQPIFLYNIDPHYHVASFIATLEYLVFHSKIQKKLCS